MFVKVFEFGPKAWDYIGCLGKIPVETGRIGKAIHPCLQELIASESYKENKEVPSIRPAGRSGIFDFFIDAEKVGQIEVMLPFTSMAAEIKQRKQDNAYNILITNFSQFALIQRDSGATTVTLINRAADGSQTVNEEGIMDLAVLLNSFMHIGSYVQKMPEELKPSEGKKEAVEVGVVGLAAMAIAGVLALPLLISYVFGVLNPLLYASAYGGAAEVLIIVIPIFMVLAALFVDAMNPYFAALVLYALISWTSGEVAGFLSVSALLAIMFRRNGYKIVF